jgi:hypothetical protein
MRLTEGQIRGLVWEAITSTSSAPDLDKFKPAIARLLRSAIDEARQVFVDDLTELEMIEQDETRRPDEKTPQELTIIKRMAGKIRENPTRSMLGIRHLMVMLTNKVVEFLGIDLNDAPDVYSELLAEPLDKLCDLIAYDFIDNSLYWYMANHVDPSLRGLGDPQHRNTETFAHILLSRILYAAAVANHDRVSRLISYDLANMSNDQVRMMAKQIESINSVKLTVPESMSRDYTSFSRDSSSFAGSMIADRERMKRERR